MWLLKYGTSRAMSTCSPVPSRNVTVQVGKDPGHDGVLVVDTGAPQLRERILAEIRKLSDLPVRFIINTSMDADHIGGERRPLEARRETARPGPG